jgi:hypothetical protein
MRVSNRIWPGVLLALAMAAPLAAAPRSTDGLLSADEAATLVYMREEEKLARDVYLTLYQQWGLNVFALIAESEQTHTSTVAKMLDKYGIPDPVVDDRVGVFADPHLSALYESLIARGFVSELEALYVGGAIEELDMFDIQNAIDETDETALQTMYEELLRGSRNHLRAFVSQIEGLGIDYTAQYLSQEAVDLIVASPMETGISRH